MRPYRRISSCRANARLSPRIFVSYSHVDRPLVAPVVEVLRASENYVFFDSDSIRPGKKWREELEAAIANSDKIMVFWCEHSEASIEVGKEIGIALGRGKDLLPLLLDSTALPPRLGEYQYIDFRAAFGRAHNPPTVTSVTQESTVRGSPMPASSSKRVDAVQLLSTIVVMGLVFVLMWLNAAYIPSPWHWGLPVVALLAAVVAVGSLFKGGVGAPPLVLPPTVSMPPPEPNAQAIAGRIEDELNALFGVLPGRRP